MGAIFAAAAALSPGVARAHGAGGRSPHDAWRTWDFNPLILLGLGLAVAIYLRGVLVIWRHAGHGRGIGYFQATAFGGAMLALATALLSPVDALGDALLSAHMVQHLLLMLVAAPLFALAAPMAPLLLGLPPYTRRTVAGLRHAPFIALPWQLLRRPLVAWTLQTVALWTWHLPPLYQAALHSNVIHGLEHLSFFATAAIFWWIVIQPERRHRDSPGLSILLVFAAGLQSGVLGALLTFSGSSWYADYRPDLSGWRLSPLEDQQLAGVIMWVPGGLIYLTVALGLLVRWLKTDFEGSMDRTVAWPDGNPASRRRLGDSLALGIEKER
jgi:putative membrane protein